MQPSNPVKPQQPLLRDAVVQALEHYFLQLGEQSVEHLYDFVLAEVEAPLFETVLRYVEGNQTKAAKILGLSRGTLRKKLRHYHLEQDT